MDGKGQWTDNVFIERLRRSLKYECVYLNAFENFRDAQRQTGFWMDYYNEERPHSRLGGLTLGEVYVGMRPMELAASTRLAEDTLKWSVPGTVDTAQPENLATSTNSRTDRTKINVDFGPLRYASVRRNWIQFAYSLLTFPQSRFCR